MGQRVDSGGWKTDKRGFIAGRLPYRPESALISLGTVQGISDHCGVLLDVEWAENVFVA